MKEIDDFSDMTPQEKAELDEAYDQLQRVIGTLVNIGIVVPPTDETLIHAKNCVDPHLDCTGC